MASTAVVSYIYNILVVGRIETRSVTFSTKAINVKSVGKEAEKKNGGIS